PQHLPRFGGPPLEPVFAALPGLSGSTLRRPSVLLEALSQPDFKRRLYALEMMRKFTVPVAPFVEKLTALALDSSKQVREAAQGLLKSEQAAARPLLEHKALSGENDERALAARLLWDWEGESARTFLEGCVKEEKNSKVARTIEDLLVVHQS